MVVRIYRMKKFVVGNNLAPSPLKGAKSIKIPRNRKSVAVPKRSQALLKGRPATKAPAKNRKKTNR